jgi:glycosyltransferase involved in cell wall biosynthesis
LFLEETKRLARRLGLEKQIEFRGRIPRAQLLDTYDQFDVLLFPSLHDSGGYAVIEAMCCGLPVICVKVGGPGISVRDECGVRVRPGSRASVVGSLAAAIRMYDQNRSLVIEHGRNAWESVIKYYDWSTKAAEMDALYRSVAATGP